MKKQKQIGILFNVLEKLEFSLSKESNPEIVFVKNQPKNLHPKNYIALEFAEIFEADAVFFRYYEDSRFCVPQIYFYDNTITARTKNDVAEIHKRVYSSCQVPIICFVDNAIISIYDCRLPVKQISNNEISNNKCLFESDDITSLAKISKYFTAKHLNYGLFWETEKSAKHFLNNKSAYETLVAALSKIRDAFVKDCLQQKIEQSFAEDILFKCILIKYLEENGKGVDEFGKEKDEAKKFYKSKGLNNKSLSDFLINGQLLDLLDVLENHFNGNVFEITNEKERSYLTNKKLPELAHHLDGYLDKGNQLTIWQVYSFKDIPIELISNFYEEFIPKDDVNKGTVYTPSFLVNLLIDECLPLSNKKEDKNYNLKIIDPSCGSGIFVSSAFKRLVQRYRIFNGKKGIPLDKREIDLNEIKKILSTCIYGVDRNKTALKLTNFSLQLALCQAVPNNILWNWTKGKVFNSLKENIYENDFFDFLVDEKKLLGTFDWVIGNPPFEKFKGENNEIQKIYAKLAIQKRPILISTKENTENQIALTFFEASMHLLKNEIGKTCLIIPAGELLYFNESYKFRNKLLNQYNVPQILDFTLLRRKLFNSKEKDTTVPVIALFANNKKPTNESIQHIVIRRTQKSKEKIYFEIDHYDFYEVAKEFFEKETYCWKSNLYGGHRVLDVVNKFYGNNIKSKKIKRLETFLSEISINRTKGLHQVEIKKSIKDGRFPDFKPHGEEAIFLSSTIKNSIDDFINNYLLNEKLQPINNFFMATTSGRQGLRGAYTILDSDFYNIPYFNVEKLNTIFSENELIIINDVAKYRIEEFGDGENAPINQPITNPKTIQEFGEVYSNELNNFYKKETKEYKVEKVIEGNCFYACKVIYTAKNIETKYITSEEQIDNLLKEQVGTNTVFNKILRIFKDNGNSITFIKPKILRYWLKSIALRDADDTFDLIIEKGMK